MKPQRAECRFVEETNEIVAAPGVSEFMDEDGAEFARIENALDAGR